MLLFCPSCSNMLTLSRLPTEIQDDGSFSRGHQRFECRTCPYEFIIDKPYYEKKVFKPKKAEDILGGEESMEMLEKANVLCKDTQCNSQQAYVRQVQIRSADEPMTSFFTCVKCLRRWQEN